jgi:DNA-directed RNA polymerase subunit RPC12/RpoP
MREDHGCAMKKTKSGPYNFCKACKYHFTIFVKPRKSVYGLYKNYKAHARIK